MGVKKILTPIFLFYSLNRHSCLLSIEKCTKMKTPAGKTVHHQPLAEKNSESVSATLQVLSGSDFPRDHSTYPPLSDGDIRNSATSENRFGSIFMILSCPMKADFSILIPLLQQYSMKSETLKKWRLGVSYHA